MIFILVPILALIPAFFWFFIFLREDRFDPEPKKLIIKLFLLGALSGILAAVLELVISDLIPTTLGEIIANFFEDPVPGVLSIGMLLIIIFSVFVFAALEEIIKIGVVRKFVYHHVHFRQVVDGAIFGVSVGLGFATLENLGYFIEVSISGGLAELFVLFFLRFFASTLLHAVTTGLAGYYLAKSKFTGNKKYFWQGLVAAVLIHTAFNVFVFGEALGFVLVIIFMIIMATFFIRRMESVEAQTIWGLVSLRGTKKNPTS